MATLTMNVCFGRCARYQHIQCQPGCWHNEEITVSLVNVVGSGHQNNLTGHLGGNIQPLVPKSMNLVLRGSTCVQFGSSCMS